MIFMHRLLSVTSIGSRTQSPAFTSLFAYLKTFLLPQPMNPLGVHTPAVLAKQNRYPAITISRPAHRQFMHIAYQSFFFLADLVLVTLR